MSEKFTLVIAPHKAFGALGTLTVTGQPPRRFTQQEALIVSRALDAVATGASLEREIFMSPIASDVDFEAAVGAEGIVISAPRRPPAPLDWTQTRALANALRAFDEG